MLNIFKKFKNKLAKTKSNFVDKISETLSQKEKIDDELYDELEEVLIESDIGADLSLEAIDQLRESIEFEPVKKISEVMDRLIEILRYDFLEDYDPEKTGFKLTNAKPFVVLFTGVNGVGKTTSIGKLAHRLRQQGKSVLLIAADTFRAAAIEQLEIWAERSDSQIIRQEQGSDPSSVIYDGLTAAVNRGVDIVLIDTAGRQHTKINLMNELAKINRTIAKVIPKAPHESLLVLDATTGQNAVTQAKLFGSAADLTGLVLTKLDGTAKGGIVLGIRRDLNLPVQMVGLGEQIDDLQDFNPLAFLNALFAKDENEEK